MIRSLVLELPEVTHWQDMAGIFEQAMAHPRQVWEWPLLACQAVGGDACAAMPEAAAIMCLMLGITLVDDMLDADPRGAHQELGQAPTANLALAFQAAGLRLSAAAGLDAERRSLIQASLAEMALATAYGQDLDVHNAGGEANYWRVIHAKSTPFYATATYIGALAGNATTPVANALREFGVLCGEMIQILDDLTDAFKTPANPDWQRSQNNLTILYALTANHPERTRFERLLPGVKDPTALHYAQQILIRSGAVSYSAFQLIKRYQSANELLARIPLTDPTPLRHILVQHMNPVIHLFQKIGVSVPPELVH